MKFADKSNKEIAGEIKAELQEELNYKRNRAELGLQTRLDRAAIRHIKAALRGELFADQICMSWMVCSIIFSQVGN